MGGKLAVAGGAPVRDVAAKPWPGWPVFGDDERRRLLETFDSGKWWYGERVREFERGFADFQTARFGVSCATGSAALEMGLAALGIGAGDEVIVPPYTFVATATAVLRQTAVPIFADISLDTTNLDPADVERKITPRTRAVMPVHFAGLPADMDAFGALAEKHGLAVVEDACHSWGSAWKGKGTGALGDCGAFSFQMSKNITSGEGGILLTDREDVADAARSFSNCGRSKTGPWYEHPIAGDNLRMTEMQAAILLGQLGRLGEQTARREENAAILSRALAGIPGVVLPARDPRVTRRSWHMFTFRFLAEEWGVSREVFLKALAAEGIPAMPGYPIPLYRNPLFRSGGPGAKGCPRTCPFRGEPADYTDVSCPNAERMCAEAVWIGHPLLLGTAADMADIAAAAAKLWESRSALNALSV